MAHVSNAVFPLCLQTLRAHYRRLSFKIGTFRRYASAIRDLHGRYSRTCPICKRESFFVARGSPLRPDALCVHCGSLERHRQHFLLLEMHADWLDGKRCLHFAPEVCFENDYARRCLSYVRADLAPRRGEIKIDVQDMRFDNDSFDILILHQVLEHVPDDRRAVSEMFRVLSPGGVVVFSVPIVLAWQKTVYMPEVCAADLKSLLYGQKDHVRYYGNDLVRLFEDAGFIVDKFIAEEPFVARHGLIRGDVIFYAQKPAGPRRHIACPDAAQVPSH